MQIVGEWYLFDDGTVRPVVRARVASPAESSIEIPLLIDTAADCTVLSADLLPALRSMMVSRSPEVTLSGIGGGADYLLLKTPLIFTRDDGQPVQVRGQFAIFTEPASSDLSAVGRDVLDNFVVIIDRPGGWVLLLAPRHRYRVEVG
ncbi:MAG: hypothetical protein HY318_09145 [Armatimonadetes bacterium]|nr:hypothetical protein [Armatimonadota bacterium]